MMETPGKRRALGRLLRAREFSNACGDMGDARPGSGRGCRAGAGRAEQERAASLQTPWDRGQGRMRTREASGMVFPICSLRELAENCDGGAHDTSRGSAPQQTAKALGYRGRPRRPLHNDLPSPRLLFDSKYAQPSFPPFFRQHPVLISFLSRFPQQWLAAPLSSSPTPTLNLTVWLPQPQNYCSCSQGQPLSPHAPFY